MSVCRLGFSSEVQMHCINGLRGVSLNQLLAQKLERVPRQDMDLSRHETLEHQLTLRVYPGLRSIFLACYIPRFFQYQRG